MRGGNGDDNIVFQTVADVANSINVTDGGIGRDILDFQGSSSAITYDLSNTSRFVAQSIEGIGFGQGSTVGTTTIQFTNVRVIAGEFDRFFDVFGRTTAIDNLQITISRGGGFDATAFRFFDWETRDTFTIIGSSIGDKVDGSNEADIIRGGEGADTLNGQLGRDEIFGGSGNDTIIIHNGGLSTPGEILDGGTNVDTLSLVNLFTFDSTFDLRPHTVTGLERIQLSGPAANNGALFDHAQLVGKAITIDFVSTFPQTTETLTIFVEGLVSTNLSQLSFANLQAADRIVLRGDDGEQAFNGLSVGETVFAGGNGDALRSSAGRDELHGEVGDDVLLVSLGAHVVAGEIYDGGADFDALVVSAAGAADFSTATVTSIERVEFAGTAGTVITFGAHQIGAGGIATDAEIFCDINGQSNFLDINLSASNWLVDLSAWSLVDWQTNDVINIRGSDEADRIVGSTNVDGIQGGNGGDQIDGRGGADFYIGGDGDDIYMSDGTDTILEFSDQGRDLVIAQGNVAALADNLEDIFMEAGNASAISATGNGLANTILGNEFDNVLSGSDGNDVIDGSAGLDTLDGGVGVDTNDSSTFSLGYRWDMTTGVVTFELAAGSELAVNFENAVTGDGNDMVTGTTGAGWALSHKSVGGDSSCESSVIAGVDEQTEHTDLRDPELARV